MVDPTKGIGSVQNLISGTRVSEPRRASDVKDTSAPKDEVTLSPKALSLSEAKDASESVRSLVESDTSLTLGVGDKFDELL